MIEQFLRSDLLKVVLANGTSKAALVAAEVVIAQRLGLSTLGLVSVGISILVVLGTVSGLGLPWMLAREWADASTDSGRRTLSSGSCLASFIVGSVIGGALLLGTGLSSLSAPRSSVFVLVALAIPLESTNQAIGGVLRAQGRPQLQTIGGDIWRNIGLISLAVLAPKDAGASDFLLAFLMLTGLGTLSGLILIRHQLSMASLIPGLTFVKDLRRHSLSVSLWNILQLLAGRVQIVLASLFLLDTELGLLSLAFRSMFLITFVQSSVNAVIPSRFARHLSLNDRGSLTHEYLCATRLLASATAIITATVLAASPLLLPSLIASSPGKATLFLLLAAQTLNTGTGPMGQVLVATRSYPQMLKIALSSVFLQFGLSLLLLPIVGLLGVAVAEAAKTTWMTIVRLHVGSKHLASGQQDLARIIRIGSILLVAYVAQLGAFELTAEGTQVVLLLSLGAFPFAVFYSGELLRPRRLLRSAAP